MKNILRAILSCAISFLATNAFAGEGAIGPVYLQSVNAIQANIRGHQAGNLEIQIAGGFTVPPGVACDPNYITTLRSVDADKRMFGLLSLALATQKPVSLYITDNPAVTAYGGRCSLIWVAVER